MSDDIKRAIRPSVIYPLTARSKRAYDYREKLTNECDNKEKCNTLDNQDKAIDIIKEHIAKTKKEFLCHQSERIENEIRRKKEMENKILAKYNINLKDMAQRSVIAEKLLNYKRTRQAKLSKQKERMMNIIQKLLTECEEKEKRPKPKIWAPRIKELVVETPFEFEEQIVEDEEVAEEQEWIDLPKETVNKDKKKDRKEKQNKQQEKKDKKSKSDKKSSKSSKEKKSKGSSKKDKKGKKCAEEFIMPLVPITNPRTKIKPEDATKMADLLQPLQDCNDFLDDRQKFYSKEEFQYPNDLCFSSKPSTILFDDFENGKTYKQKVVISNNSSETVHCKYEKIMANDDFSIVTLEVEDMPVQKLLPGMHFICTITFRPKDIKHFEGHVIFTTRRPHSYDIKQFEIPFICKLESIKININPTNVIFKSIPIWEMKKSSHKNYKTVQIQNEMIKECTLIIRKIKDEFDETYESKTQNEQDEIKTSNSIASLNSVQLLLNECFENISNIFHFTTYFVIIPPKTSINLKIYFKNSPFVGVHQEKFEFEFFERRNNEFISITNEDVLVQAETTGKFIVTETDYLDFNTCVLNLVYQQSFTVYNNETFPVKIGFQFPSKLKEYFSVYPQTFFLKPNSKEIVSLRFIPRKEILETNSLKYYDEYTGILNFPIRICLLSKIHQHVPPTILTVYAILAEPDGIKLRTIGEETLPEEDGFPVINLGEVTTHETVLADFEIHNISVVQQGIAFLNLPENIIIGPDFGFAILEPNETKKFQIQLSPTVLDMVKDQKHTTEPIDLTYKITCTTLYKNCGVPRKRPKTANFSDIEELSDKEILFDQIYSKKVPSLIDLNEEDQFDTEDKLQTELLQTFDLYYNDNNLNTEESLEEEDILEEENFQTKNLSILVKATLVDYWTELSHQYIEFPGTPLGSYSTMGVQITAINNSSNGECVCGYVKKFRHSNFACHFEICGGCEDISIEPICGDLAQGQSINLLLTAKPTIESHLLQQTAKIYKVQKVASEKQGKKKGQKGSPKGKPNFMDHFDNISLHNCDYYPAEKEIEKTIRSYTIKTQFTFVVTFEEDSNKTTEILYLTAQCKVTRPDFITNLTTQFINFGPTAISTSSKTIISIENISRRMIHPVISPMCPVGPFSCNTHKDVWLDKEFILKVPLSFTPTQEIFYKEYFEIKSGNTIESLVVAGEGVLPDFEFVPKFNVCRIQAKLGKFADCVFQLNNKCTAPLKIRLVKLCELKGKIQPKPILKEEKIKNTDNKKGKGKEKDKSSKSSNSNKKGKPQKLKKYSEELSSDEQYSIENFYETFNGESQFRVMNANDDVITIEPFAKSKIKIRFETPKPPVEKNTKEKGNKKGKKEWNENSSKSSKSSKESKKEKDVKYIAKYNVMLGDIVLIKDLIIIAEFI